MNSPARSGSAARDSVPPSGISDEEAAPIKAVPLRHPIRNLIAAIIIVIVASFIYDAALRETYDWPTFATYVFDHRIAQAALVTLELTVYSMIIGIILGLVLAVMRLSLNPVFKSISWVYIWIFRGTPIYVQLTFWGLLGVIYPTIALGVPLLPPVITLSTDANLSFFVLAVIGLGLNEAAYVAEIVRAGILSVDRGQEEAATALGMSWLQTMWRVIIPQSMRVIIPPIGNEIISMLKTTSLVVAVPLAGDLYSVARDISVGIFRPIPLFLVASVWYLAFTSILMVGQYFLERRFGRGIGDQRTLRQPSEAR